MPKLSELVANEAPATIPLDLGSVSVVYRPRVLTPNWEAGVGAAEREGDHERSIYGPIRDLVVSWDLQREDGEPYELTSEGLADVPRSVLQSVLIGVILAARPNAQRLLGRSTATSAEQ